MHKRIINLYGSVFTNLFDCERVMKSDPSIRPPTRIYRSKNINIYIVFRCLFVVRILFIQCIHEPFIDWGDLETSNR